jgi:hypothetical protein
LTYQGDVVQFWLERRPVTPEVAGSSPVVPAMEFEKPILFWMGFLIDRPAL